MNTPGSTFDFRSTLYHQGKVWYWYYDINEENRNACLEANKDIIKSPADVPLDDMSFEDINEPSKIWVRRYFIALCKETLGRVRGTYSGKVPIPDADIQMDYQSLLTEGRDEIVTLKTELNDRLVRMTPDAMIKRMADEAEDVNRSLKYRPFTHPIRVI